MHPCLLRIGPSATAFAEGLRYRLLASSLAPLADLGPRASSVLLSAYRDNEVSFFKRRGPLLFSIPRVQGFDLSPRVPLLYAVPSGKGYYRNLRKRKRLFSLSKVKSPLVRTAVTVEAPFGTTVLRVKPYVPRT